MVNKKTELNNLVQILEEVSFFLLIPLKKKINPLLSIAVENERRNWDLLF